MIGDSPPSPAGPAFTASLAEAGGTLTVALAGELDLAWAATVRDAFDAARASTAPTVVVDLGGLHFIDSTGLRELVILHQALLGVGRTLVCTPGGPAVQRVLGISGLLDVLPFTPRTPADGA